MGTRADGGVAGWLMAWKLDDAGKLAAGPMAEAEQKGLVLV